MPHATRGDLNNFEWCVIVGARLAGASVINAVEIGKVCQGTVSKVMSAWERERMMSSSKDNNGWKHILDKRDAWALVQTVT